MYRSDVFIVMDEVQLSDSAYQHRNLFLTADGKTRFLTIPFVKGGYLKRPFRELEITASDWRVRHLDFIRNSYRRHPYADAVMEALEQYYAADYRLLVDAVLASMRLAFELFGIETRVMLQSAIDYDRSLRRGELVLALVRASRADCYLSGTGAKTYLDESAFRGGLSLQYNEFEHPVYPQKLSSNFQPGLACLDALFNLGPAGAQALLEHGRGVRT